MKTLVLGIGNPILGDDGVGFHAAQELRKLVRVENIDVKEVNTGGLNLLEIIKGYDRVIIIDAIKTENGRTGQIHKLKPDALISFHATHPHDINLATAIKIGNVIGEEMPKEIVIFAIEVEKIKFTEEMTEEVGEAIQKVVDLVLNGIKNQS